VQRANAAVRSLCAPTTRRTDLDARGVDLVIAYLILEWRRCWAGEEYALTKKTTVLACPFKLEQELGDQKNILAHDSASLWQCGQRITA
jgi:hypothetical protein